MTQLFKIRIIFLFILQSVNFNNCFADTCKILLPYKLNDMYGFKDCNGNIVVENIYSDCITDVNNQYYRVVKNGLFGIVDVKGNIVVDIQHYYIDYLSSRIDSFFIGRNSSNKWGVLSTRNKTIVEFKYDKIYYIGNSCFIAQNQTQFWFINNRDNITELLPEDINQNALYQLRVSVFNTFCLKKEDRSIYYLNVFGEKLYNLEYKLIGVNEKRKEYIVKKGRKVGVVDRNNKILYPFVYSSIESLNDSIYIVSMNGRFNLMCNMKRIDSEVEWIRGKMTEINDSFVEVKKGRKISVFSIKDNQFIIKDYARIWYCTIDSNQYFICYKKAHSYVYKDSVIKFKVKGDLYDLTESEFITDAGCLYSGTGEIISNFDMAWSNIWYLGYGILEIRYLDSKKYFNIYLRKYISEI